MADKRRDRWSAAQAARFVDEYEKSGLTRRDYCKQAGITVRTLDYHRRRQASRSAAPLIPVKLLEATRRNGFALVLSNGRRIEADWDFAEEGLARLVRVAEQA